MNLHIIMVKVGHISHMKKEIQEIQISTKADEEGVANEGISL